VNARARRTLDRLRRLLRRAQVYSSRLARRWRSSMQAQVITTTLVVGTVTMVALGGYLTTSIRDGLFSERLDQILLESARSTSEAQATFDSANASTATQVQQLLYDMLHTHEIAMFAPLDQAYYGAMQADDFAVHLGAPWYQGFMKDNAASLAGKWKMMPLPTFEDGSGAPTATHGGTGTVITRQSRHPDLAWEFIKFANLTVEGTLAAFDMANLFPTYTPAWTDERLYRTDDYFSGQRPAAIISEVAPKIPPLNNSPYWPEVTDAFTRLVMTPVLQQSTTIDQAFADFRREVDRVVR